MAIVRAAVRDEVREALAELRAEIEAAKRAVAGELPALVTIAEARTLLRCSDRHVRRLVATGALRSMRNVKAGSSRVLIPRESVQAFLVARRAH